MLGRSVCGSGLCQALKLQLFAIFPPSIDILPLFVLSLPSLSSEVVLISVDHLTLDPIQLALFKYLESISCLPARILFVLFAWWLHLHPSIPFPPSYFVKIAFAVSKTGVGVCFVLSLPRRDFFLTADHCRTDIPFDGSVFFARSVPVCNTLRHCSISSVVAGESCSRAHT